jgi:hypothetical protein
MNCKHWNENWVAYLYDECSPEELETIQAHLDSCDTCREQMDSLAATRLAMESSASEIVAPPRVIVLPAAAPRAMSAWSFAGGFAAAAAVFAIGIFFGMTYFSKSQVLIADDGAVDLSDPVATTRVEPETDPAYRQIRNDYEQLDNRLGRIENWLPEPQGETRPALATMDRVQMAVGDLNQQFDLRRAEDLRFVVEWILATDQESRLRDARTLQTLGLVHAVNNPNVRQR